MYILIKRKGNIGETMISNTRNRSRTSLHKSPWIIIGSVGILLIVVVVLAYQNYSREKKYMSRILSEKGAAIIKAVEVEQAYSANFRPEQDIWLNLFQVFFYILPG